MLPVLFLSSVILSAAKDLSSHFDGGAASFSRAPLTWLLTL